MFKSFYGSYYKNQKAENTLAVIPGYSGDGAFIQVITDKCSYYVPYGFEEYHGRGFIRIGGSAFARDKISLDVRSRDIELTGRLTYRGLTPLESDIMGPFRFFPVECRHSVISMRHRIEGRLLLNGEMLDFNGGTGYIEADSGRSFPQKYTWVQSNAFDEPCSIMVSAAKIPFMGFRFWGCVCAIWHNGNEYRMATYTGARIIHRSFNRLELSDGRLRLIVDINKNAGHKLFAPQNGSMSRIIREAASVKARFRFSDGNALLFDKESDGASYEHVE